MSAHFEPSLQYIPVTRKGTAIFIPLPHELQRPIEGGCACVYCTEDHSKPSVAYWDTLAVSAKPGKSTDSTWTVHAPELHGATRKREGP